MGAHRDSVGLECQRATGNLVKVQGYLRRWGVYVPINLGKGVVTPRKTRHAHACLLQ